MKNIQTAHVMTGQKVSRMRSQRQSDETVKNEFTDEERKKRFEQSSTASSDRAARRHL